MKVFRYAILTFGLMVASFIFGFAVYQEWLLPEPQVVVVEKPVIERVEVPMPVTKTIYRDVDPVIIENTVYTGQLQYFETKQDLQRFVDQNYSAILERGRTEGWDGCVDWAQGWQTYFAEHGYLISTWSDIKGETGHELLSAWTKSGYKYAWDIFSRKLDVVAEEGIKGGD